MGDLERNQLVRNALVDEVCNECRRRMANGLKRWYKFTGYEINNYPTYLIIPIKFPFKLADELVK